MNFLKKIKHIGIITSAVVLTFTSCKKEFFDINDNPNSPKTVKLSEVLPTAQLAIGHAIGSDLKIAGGLWSQYWAQDFAASQYKSYDQYNISADAQRQAWNLLYADALTDLNYVIKLGTAEAKPNYVAIATILKAYNFQVLTDAYGNVPFSEAGKGDEGIFSPKYDDQKDVYNGIIAMLKDGISQIDLTSAVHPEADDFIYHGDMHLWLKFANTTLLKIYLRISQVDPAKAQAGLAELKAKGAEFIDEGETAKIDYYTAGGNTNPLYASYVALSTTRNIVANSTGIKAFTKLSDDRLSKLYTPAGNSFVGIPSGYLGVPNTGGIATPPTSLSYASAITGAMPASESATAPVIFIADYESYFLQAEADARGWGVGSGTAEQLYNDGIALSYEFLGLAADTTTSYANYINHPEVKYSTQTDKLQAIFFQKWYAMCGLQNFEAWTEGRRTGYIEANMGLSHLDNKFFTKSITGISNDLPARMLYPLSEVTRNEKFPGQKQLGDKVWWAK